METLISATGPVLTNVGIFRSIADDAYKKMSADMDENIRPSLEGGDGFIKVFNPEQHSFKQAMISIVFTCIWLEADMHLRIVGILGRESAKNVDGSNFVKNWRVSVAEMKSC